MKNNSPTTHSRQNLTRFLLVIFLVILSGLLLYKEAITGVLIHVLNRGDSSHGIFVPVLSAYFLWLNKDRIRDVSVRYSWWGALPLVVCSIPPLFSIGSFQVQFIAFIGFVCGILLAIAGKGAFSVMAFPILFLITMTPLPQDLYIRLADISRTIAFGGSLKVISWLKIPHIRVGWDLQLPNAVLRVNESCSGIRYLISFFVFGLAYAYLTRRSFTARMVTVLATIPVSLFASVCRLTIIFVMTYYVSPFWSQHRPHVTLSWFVFFSILFSGIFFDQLVKKYRL